VALLLRYKADPLARDDKGNTPLDKARQMRQHAAYSMLSAAANEARPPMTALTPPPPSVPSRRAPSPTALPPITALPPMTALPPAPPTSLLVNDVEPRAVNDLEPRATLPPPPPPPLITAPSPAPDGAQHGAQHSCQPSPLNTAPLNTAPLNKTIRPSQTALETALGWTAAPSIIEGHFGDVAAAAAPSADAPSPMSVVSSAKGAWAEADRRRTSAKAAAKDRAVMGAKDASKPHRRAVMGATADAAAAADADAAEVAEVAAMMAAVLGAHHGAVDGAPPSTDAHDGAHDGARASALDGAFAGEFGGFDSPPSGRGAVPASTPSVNTPGELTVVQYDFTAGAAASHQVSSLRRLASTRPLSAGARDGAWLVGVNGAAAGRAVGVTRREHSGGGAGGAGGS
jgi:hypothetical protein